MMLGLGLPDSWFWSLMAFIPKRSGPALAPEDFRPIALEQVQLKFLHRWLAGRLQSWASNVVHSAQFGFLRGRNRSAIAWLLQRSLCGSVPGSLVTRQF